MSEAGSHQLRCDQQTIEELPELSAASIRRNVLWKNQIQVTPWRDCHEFSSVGQALVAAADVSNIDSEKLQRALECVVVWRVRSQRLPHAIESSAALAQLLWREHCDATNITSTELRMSYAATIIRAINGLADALDQDRYVATSIAKRSDRLGIPNWLVEVRHQATHNELPSLAALRMAATTLLHYFEAIYWEPLEKKRLDLQEKAFRLLQDYQDAVDQACHMEQEENAKKDIMQPMNGSGVSDKVLEKGNESETSEEQESEDEISGAFNGPKLGMTYNSFAVLQEPKKKKKRKEAEVIEVKEARKVPKPKRKKKKAEKTVKSPSDCSRLFLKAQIPVEIAFDTALNFLINSPILVPISSEIFPPNQAGFQRLRRYHSALLVALVKEWPGFAARLLTSLVDRIISLEKSMRSAEHVADVFAVTRNLFFLFAWVEYLLEDAFFVRVDNVFEKKLSSKVAIQWLNYPIAFLRGKCMELIDSGAQCSTAKRLYEVFDKHYIERHGGNNHQTVGESGADGESWKSMNTSKDARLADPTANESLQATPCSNSDKDMASLVPGTQPVLWKLCEDWEPSSLGS